MGRSWEQLQAAASRPRIRRKLNASKMKQQPQRRDNLRWVRLGASYRPTPRPRVFGSASASAFVRGARRASHWGLALLLTFLAPCYILGMYATPKAHAQDGTIAGGIRA